MFVNIEKNLYVEISNLISVMDCLTLKNCQYEDN